MGIPPQRCWFETAHGLQKMFYFFAFQLLFISFFYGKKGKNVLLSQFLNQFKKRLWTVFVMDAFRKGKTCQVFEILIFTKNDCKLNFLM